MKLSIKSLQTSFASTVVRVEAVVQNVYSRTEYNISFDQGTGVIRDYNFAHRVNGTVTMSGYHIEWSDVKNKDIHEEVGKIVTYVLEIMDYDMSPWLHEEEDSLDTLKPFHD